ncbi:MAG TPA: hypothetical protein VE175_03825, partial [Woeseiaceae bacterium]|nr:hypothetical protein [Woeseiaceae bacterium]
MEDTAIVFESADARACSERALVLQSLGIPCEILRAGGLSAVVVPAELAERAKYEIREYEQENQPPRARAPRAATARYDPLPGTVVYVAVLCLTAWL